MSLRSELIQVAAVAISHVENIDNGVAWVGGDTDTTSILIEVLNERYEQDVKWGPQAHPDNTWLFILMEEVGESAEEVLDSGLVGVQRDILDTIAQLGNRCRNWLEAVGLDNPEGKS